MSANIEAKKLIVEEIKAKITASKSVVFADYNKLTVLEVTALRNEFKNANCEYKVYKNTLVRKAFNELGVTDFDADLNGTTATVFCADETSGAAVFAKAVKANPALAEKILPKCAYLENKYLDKAAHGQDIFENEGRLMELNKDETFKARKAHYTAVCAPTPAPSKQ